MNPLTSGLHIIGLLLLFLVPVAAENPMPRVHAARAAGDREIALELLARHEKDDPELFDLNGLDYLKARLLIESGRSPEGQALLSELDWRQSLLGDSILQARVEARQGRPFGEWRSDLKDFLEHYSGHPSWSRWALTYADALKEEKELDQALDWYNRVWRAGAGSHARRAALEHARLHLPRNQPGEAIKDLRNLIKKNEDDDAALQAALELHELQPPSRSSESELRQRGRVLMNNRRTRLARTYFQYLLGKYPKSLSAPQYRYLTARSYVFDGQLEKTFENYLQCYSQFPASDWGIFCKYQTGNTALRKLSYPAAVREYREFLAAHPSNRRAARVYYNLADSYRWLEDDVKAEETALQALQTVKASERNQFHYYLTRLYVEQQRYQEALPHLSHLDKLSSRRLPSGVTMEEIQYFKGLCLIRSGQKEGAQDAFRKGGTGRPNYFGYQCRAQVDEEEAVEPQASDEWLQQLIAPRPFYGSAEEVPTDGPQALAQVRELLFLGLTSEAALAIKRTGSRAFPNVGAYLFNLAFYSDQGGLPRESLLAAERLLNSRFRGTWPDQLPESVQELVYPRHYWALIQKEGVKSQVDPYLLLAVIYQESRFDPRAKSGASARGLMQFLESPARRLAEELSMAPPTAADLYRPDVSIRLGAYHLKKLLKQHGDSKERALAAYNGGSSNAKRWAAKGSQSEPAHFIANIGFRETKLYVLKVLGNYLTYQNLYGSTSEETGGTE